MITLQFAAVGTKTRSRGRVWLIRGSLLVLCLIGAGFGYWWYYNLGQQLKGLEEAGIFWCR